MESDRSTSPVKTYDPFEATNTSKSKQPDDARNTAPAALQNLMNSYQHDSDSSVPAEGTKRPRSSSSSPTRKATKRASSKRSRDSSSRRHRESRSKRIHSRTPRRHRHHRRSRSRHHHKRRRSRPRYDSSRSNESRHSKRHRSRRSSSSGSRRYRRSAAHYYRQERREPHARAECHPPPPIEPPEPIRHYYVPHHIGNQPAFAQAASNPVVPPRHKPRANLIEIIPTEANIPTTTIAVSPPPPPPKEEPIRLCPAPDSLDNSSKDLSDYLVEEMLREEELKKQEQNKIAEQMAADQLIITECQTVLDDLIEMQLLIDHLCNENNWRPQQPAQPPPSEEPTQPPTQSQERPPRPRPIVSWLCEVNVEELNSRLAAENEEPEKTSSAGSSRATPAWSAPGNCLDVSFSENMLNEEDEEDDTADRKIVDNWLEKDSKPTNGIDELMERIFHRKNSADERIVNWMGKEEEEAPPPQEEAVATNEPDDDEPYDPEVEEARLSAGTVQRRNGGADKPERIRPLSSEELPSSATELYRIQKYRQKKQRMEQVIAIAKECIKPKYIRREIDKEQYKMIMKRTVDKYMQSGRPVNKERISQMINYYIAAEVQIV